jgi:hypothetical protein
MTDTDRASSASSWRYSGRTGSAVPSAMATHRTRRMTRLAAWGSLISDRCSGFPPPAIPRDQAARAGRGERLQWQLAKIERNPGGRPRTQ